MTIPTANAFDSSGQSTDPDTRRAFRRLYGACAIAAAFWIPASGLAQEIAGNVAIPFYTSVHAAQGLYSQWYAPQAMTTQRAAASLAQKLESYCHASAKEAVAPLADARHQLRNTANEWEKLSAVAMGPLIERRSARLIDFQPLRPALLQKAIQNTPQDLSDLERIGAPAKGFPALEFLLQKQIAAPGTAACQYAVLVAQEIAQETQVLSEAFQPLGVKDWADDSDATTETLAEFINQWVGGLERLRWQRLEKPLKSAGKKAPVWHRINQKETLVALKAQWQGLRTLAVSVDRTHVPVPGKDLVSIESYLRGRGLLDLANRWAKSVDEANMALSPLDELKPASLASATKSLAKLKKLMESEVAPALEVNIGFSDADGD